MRHSVFKNNSFYMFSNSYHVQNIKQKIRILNPQRFINQRFMLLNIDLQ